MTVLPEREKMMAVVAEAVNAGARQAQACDATSLSERTFQRWQIDQENGAGDRRPARLQTPKNRLSESERQRVLEIPATLSALTAPTTPSSAWRNWASAST